MPGLLSPALFSVLGLLLVGADSTVSHGAAHPGWRRALIRPASSGADPVEPAAFLPLPTGDRVLADGRLGRLYLWSKDGLALDQVQGVGGTVVEWTALALKGGLSFLALDGPGGIVHQFDLRGNYLGTALDVREVAAAEGLGPVEPAGLAVDDGGSLWITDRLGDRLLMFSSSWTLIGVWGESGSGPGQLRRPGAVCAGQDRALISDRGNRRLVLMDEWGEVLATMPCGVEAAALARIPGGYAAVLGSRIRFFDSDLNPGRWLDLPVSEGCAEGLYGAGALVAAREGLYVGEGCSGGVFLWEGLKEREP